MFYLILTTIVGISFAPFLFYKLDIWHSQGIWTQICLLVIFSWSFFEKPKKVILKNVPLGLLHLWIGLLTAYLCYKSQVMGKYNVQNFFPYFNFLCLLWLYKFVLEYLDKDKIVKILEGMRWVAIATLVVCVLQKFNLSQFFYLFVPESKHFNNLVVGFIGNGTHLSGFLAMCIPLFLLKITKENVLCLVLLFVLFFFTGTSIQEPSASGFIIAPILFLIFFFRKNRTAFYLLLVFICLFVSSVFYFFPQEINFFKAAGEVKHPVSVFLYNNGRFELWAFYWEQFSRYFPITGVGLGKINQVYTQTPFPSSRHLHLEYFQFAFEAGLIGFGLIMNLIYSFYKRVVDDDVSFILMLVVTGFLLSCLFNYPAHLWLPATWAMFCYAAFMTLKNDKEMLTY